MLRGAACAWQTFTKPTNRMQMNLNITQIPNSMNTNTDNQVGERTQYAPLQDLAQDLVDELNGKSWPYNDSREHLLWRISKIGAIAKSHKELLEACKSSLKVFHAWLHDADPHNELGTGDSDERDAAVIMIKLVSAAIRNVEYRPLTGKALEVAKAQDEALDPMNNYY